MAVTQKSLENLWLKALMVVLFGYALLGKEFAYLFFGEMLVLVGCIFFLRSKRITLILSDPTLFIWAVFALWGICRTVPFIGKYGFYAVRDAALWGYGLVAVLLVAFVNNSNQISRALNEYRRFLAWFVPCIPVLLILALGAGMTLPPPPWAVASAFPVMKVSDASVHLAGAALMMLIFPHQRHGAAKQGVGIFRMFGFLIWVLSTLIVLLGTRGGFLAIVVPIILVSALKFQRIGWKVATAAAIIGILVFAIVGSDLLTVKIRGRQYTPDQIKSMVTSIFSSTEHQELEGSKEWRLGWWRNIIDYTIFGPYFWTGKGFGINLAVEDGPPGITAEDTALRSPHNGSMTVLARMGVPGALLWLALNLSFAIRLLAAYRQANQAGLRFWTGVNLWIFCFWLATMVNLSFDVYLEGPQGGMWFWAAMGLGLAAMRIQAYEARRLRTQQQYQVAV